MNFQRPARDFFSQSPGATSWARLACYLLAIATACTGCATHQQLRRHTVSTNLTVADIYYDQVLSNLARFVNNPNTMASFSIVSAGTVNLEDVRGGAVSPTYSPTLTRALQGGGALPILSIFFGVNAERSVTENWSTLPVNDSDNLRRMRCAFQIAVGGGNTDCDHCKERLEGFFLGSTESYDCLLPTGWYHVGTEDDVPPNACYVGNYCDTYVWVTPDGMDDFSRFTITILDIATGEIHAPQRTVVKSYKGEAIPQNLESTQVTSTEPDLDSLKEAQKYHLDRERTDTPTINRGLFFLPR